MEGTRQTGTAATRRRWPLLGVVTTLVALLALLLASGAQGRPERRAATEVVLEVLAARGGAVNVTPDLDGNDRCDDAFVACRFRYLAPTEVVLTAQQTDSAFDFHGWTAAECPAANPGPGALNQCRLELREDEPLVSVFALYDPSSLSIRVSGPGKVTWPGGECSDACSPLLPAGTPIVFTAVPDDPAHPIEWVFGCDPVPGNPRQCVARPENRVLGLKINNAPGPDRPFEVDVTLRLSNGGTGSGRITGSDGFNCGTGDDCRKRLAYGKLVTLQAERADGSQFERWVGGVCGTNPTCRFNVGPITSVQARFVPAAPPPPPPPP